MTPSQQLDQWHGMIKPDHDAFEIYKGLVLEEIKEAADERILNDHIKELVDIVVTARGARKYTDNGIHWVFFNALENMAYDLMLSHDIDPDEALRAVNESNFSKLILADEIDEAQAYFESLGISVEIKDLDGGYFGAYSTHDQTLNGKKYAKGKLLKGPKYRDIDTSVKWW